MYMFLNRERPEINDFERKTIFACEGKIHRYLFLIISFYLYLYLLIREAAKKGYSLNGWAIKASSAKKLLYSSRVKK